MLDNDDNNKTGRFDLLLGLDIHLVSANENGSFNKKHSFWKKGNLRSEQYVFQLNDAW